MPKFTLALNQRVRTSPSNRWWTIAHLSEDHVELVASGRPRKRVQKKTLWALYQAEGSAQDERAKEDWIKHGWKIYS